MSERIGYCRLTALVKSRRRKQNRIKSQMESQMRNRRRSPVSFAGMNIHPEKRIALRCERRVNGIMEIIVLPENAPGKKICEQ